MSTKFPEMIEKASCMKFLSYLICLVIGLLISSVGMYLAYASAPEHFVVFRGIHTEFLSSSRFAFYLGFTD